ncbi:FadR family transcriptional regulator [Tsukamurella sp. M9C]|uniref:FadR/GntR family transcriptional regulator n=1 Tax=Tsukamurella sp. M9C TaxID=2877520 RepID=UPI001CCFE649|nr:FadR/GntR family transcriptional regulator [Tsukamurella sp. M9C]MCA0156014.1 FadR family transcriptional regulator [Tsukamurella sp. M9C]
MTAMPAMPQRTALVGQVINILRSEIARGRWLVGSKLPVESELATEYGISKATLRQAVQALVHVGVLETIQGNGTFVRASDELGPVLSRYLAEEDDVTVLEVREAIEATVAALAATRATDEEIAAMEELIDRADAAVAVDDLETSNARSVDFHAAVVSAARNPVLHHFYDAIEAATVRTIRSWTTTQAPQDFQREHRAILAAISDRDPERARALSREHLAPVLAAARTSTEQFHET